MAPNNFQEGFNQNDFEKLFKTHIEHLTNFAFQYVQDVNTAKDICQKAFISLWEKRNQLDQSKSIKSYLFTSTRNYCLNYIRDNKKYRSELLDVECAEFEIVAEEEKDSSDLTTKINAALNLLPAKARQVFEMSRLQGMKYKEIAAELDIAQKTVEAHMSRALRTLREQLKDYELLLFLFLINIY